MKRMVAFIGTLLLASFFLSGCVTAKEHEELDSQNRDLRGDLRSQKRLLREARRDHRAIERQLRQQLSQAQDQLEIKQDDLRDLRRNHKDTSDELSELAAKSRTLFEDKKQLNATIIKLRGTISTLRDTAKDLQTRLDEATAAKTPSGSEAAPPSKAPQ